MALNQKRCKCNQKLLFTGLDVSIGPKKGNYTPNAFQQFVNYYGDSYRFGIMDYFLHQMLQPHIHHSLSKELAQLIAEHMFQIS